MSTDKDQLKMTEKHLMSLQEKILRQISVKNLSSEVQEDNIIAIQEVRFSNLTIYQRVTMNINTGAGSIIFYGENDEHVAQIHVSNEEHSYIINIQHSFFRSIYEASLNILTEDRGKEWLDEVFHGKEMSRDNPLEKHFLREILLDIGG